jgi:predicted ATPase
MKLRKVEIENFRCFQSFALELGGESAFLVAPNGGGKSSFLEAVAKGCGVTRSMRREDFADLSKPLEVVLTIQGIPAEAAGIFADHTTFSGGPPVLRIGLRATWDDEEQELDVVHGFPDRGWAPSTRAQREVFPVLWLPAHRDPARSLQMAGGSSVLSGLVATLNLADDLETATEGLKQVAEELAAAEPLTQLLHTADAELNRLSSHENGSSFDLASAAGADDDILRQLELVLSDGKTPSARPVGRQSSGLAQLALFAFVLRALNEKNSEFLLLMDEPELSLHPHAQRALSARLKETAEQTLIATHSSNVLDQADPRRVVRLRESTDGVEPASAGDIGDTDASRLVRISDPRTAEAFFARRVLIVEGESDQVAVRAFAQRMERNLDAEGISVISLEGAGSFATFFSLLGPEGLDLPLSGLCDADHASSWQGVLASTDPLVADTSAMEERGFFVCHNDLEDEFFRSLGLSGVEAALRSAGDGQALDRFIEQPSQDGSKEERLRRYVDRNKVRSAAALIDALHLDTSDPRPLQDLLAYA